MTAPKIDTQAPERDYLILKAGNMSNITFHATGMWLMKMEGGEVEFNPDIKPKAGSEQAWALLMDMSRDYNAHVRDLSAAREAAAAQAMREALEPFAKGRLDVSHSAVVLGFPECVAAITAARAAMKDPIDGTAALDRLIAERVREATAELRGLLWLACHEFNAIRARSGAPLDYQGMTTVSEEWWDQMTRAFADAVGPDAKKPWPSEEAKAVTAKIAARGSKEGQS